MEKYYSICSGLLRFSVLIIFYTTLLCATSCNKDIQKNQASSNSGKQEFKAITEAKTNIVLILVDDMGYEIPTYSGGQSYQTPNMDFLANNGIWFSQAYSHPDGSPSRQALQTGAYNFRNYVRFGYLQPEQKCIGNMLKDAGYKTCFSGKWQFGDGDAGIKVHGYDKYRVFLPFERTDQRVRRYKNPLLFENGAYLADTTVEGKYSEDLFIDYIDNFIDSNLNQPFFISYCPVLLGRPFVPTPDQNNFKTWDPANDIALDNNIYFPAMVNYLDKKIGQIIQKLRATGLENNTLIIISGDNSTSKGIFSKFMGIRVPGGKNQTNRKGTAVPMLAYCPSLIPSGQQSSTLIDFTDILPTLADIAKIPVPTNYGFIDGVSFADNMAGLVTTNNRDWVFCHWVPNATNNYKTTRYINDKKYKLYDTIDNNSNYSLFYNIKKDIPEVKPIPDNMLTNEERAIKESFIQTLNTLK